MMSLQRLTLLALSASLLGGCGGSYQKGPLVGSIESRPLPSLDRQPPADSQQAIAKAQQRYRDYLALEQETALAAEARRRLADIQLELAERAQARAVDEIDQVKQQNPQQAAAMAIPEIDYDQLGQRYEQILRDHPDYPRNDAILYQLAKVYIAQAEPEKAMAALERLSRDYPGSELAYEAQFRLGENRFIEGDYEGAARAYAEVMSSGMEKPYYDFALYKYGWTQFKLSRFDAAQDAFFSLLDSRLQGREIDSLQQLPDDDRETTADAFRSISLCIYYQQGPAALTSYFERRGHRPYEHLAYASLAKLYLEVGRSDDAIASYTLYIDNHPLSRQAPRFQLKIIDLWASLGAKAQVLAAKKLYVQDYGLNSPYWRHNDPDQAADVVEQLRLNLKELAQHYHAIARRSHLPPDYIEATLYYRDYIDYFPADGETPMMNFLLAEALREKGDLEQAVGEYERTAYDYPPHPRAGEAAYAALLAYDERLPQISDPGQQAQWRHAAVASALRFNANFPDHPQALAVLTKAAEELFQLNDTEQALEVAAAVMQRDDAPRKLRLSAATLLAHGKLDQGDYLAAEHYYQAALKLSPANAPGRKDLTEGLAAAIYKQGEEKLAANDPLGAAAQFLRVANAAPAATIVATARFDAAAALISANHWQEAIAPLEAFRREHGQNPLYDDVRRKLALAYEKTGQYHKAAREYELLSWRHKDDAEIAQAALWHAAELYRQAGQTKQYGTMLENYLRRFPADFDQAMEARQQLAELALARGDKKRYHHWLKEIIAAHQNAGTQATERSRYLAAHATLALADASLARFNAVKLVEPIKKNLKLKRKYLQSSLADYEKCATFGVADVTTAATYRIAELYSEFAKALWDSQRPAGLDELALEQYELMLEEQAMPFEDKAIELHEVNVGLTQKEGIYTPWSARSYDKLAELYPARYNRKERLEEVFTTLR